MKLPIVYYQLKKIRAIWSKSSNPMRDLYITELDNSIREIEREHLIDLALNEELEYINE